MYILILYGGFAYRRGFFICVIFIFIFFIFSYYKICFVYISFFCSGVFILLRYFLFIYNCNAILSYAVRLFLIIFVFSVLLIWNNVNLFKYRSTGNILVSAFNIIVWLARYAPVIIFKHLF